jgi:hypothetical protein
MKSIFLSAGHSDTDPGAVARNSLTASRLREVLDYNPETGEFRWRRRMSSRAGAGGVAGASDGRYVLIRIDGTLHAAHRLAWLHSFGSWPRDGIDHANGIGRDNRLANLREADHAQNAQNPRLRRDNPSGVVGVWWAEREQKWRARIRVDGRDVYLGGFATIAEAAAARAAGKARLHPFQPKQRSAA